jgi:hypothetical protein
MCIGFHNVPANILRRWHLTRLLVRNANKLSPSFDELMPPLARLAADEIRRSPPNAG